MKRTKAAVFSLFGAIAVLGGLAYAQDQSGSSDQNMPQQTAASKRVEVMVKKIKDGDNYKCCIKGKCDYCAVHVGMCNCGDNAANGKPVCINCKGGWDAGLGAVMGKTNDDIKPIPQNGDVRPDMPSDNGTNTDDNK